MAGFHLSASVSDSHSVTLSWLTGIFEYRSVIVNVISSCGFPTVTSQNVCCEKCLNNKAIAFSMTNFKNTGFKRCFIYSTILYASGKEVFRLFTELKVLKHKTFIKFNSSL